MHIDIIRSRIIKSARRAALNLPYSEQRLKFVNLSWFAYKYCVKAKKLITKTNTPWRTFLIARELWMQVFADLIMASNHSSLSVDNISERSISYKQLKALFFLQNQFGIDEKWVQINQSIWAFFRNNKGQLLRLSQIQRIANYKRLNTDDFFSVLWLFAAHQVFIKLVYYRLNNLGQIEEISGEQVIQQIAPFLTKGETEWQQCTPTIFIGWQPIESI